MKKQVLVTALVLGVCGSAAAIAQDFSGESIVAQGDKDGDKALNKAEWEAMGSGYPYPAEGDSNKDEKIDAAEMNVLIAQFMGGGAPPPPPSAPPPAAPAQAPQ